MNAHEAAAAARVEQLEREWTEANDKINELYWLFTRSARGKPPVMVAPELYARRGEIERELRQLRRAPSTAPTLTARWWAYPEERHVSRFDRRRFNLSDVPRGDDAELDAMVADWRDRGMLCKVDLIVPMEFEQLDPLEKAEFHIRFDYPMPVVKPVFIICMRDEDV